ncbi:efflux RND transporter periplasmic adaptor subunit [Sphingobacterium corticibacterium]|uniref:Efflux RND transporter periplasmic adaptor subunit n=1 Tax=Sphingobacterium corticibacterium TaxID=2484746 RepID=A0A4Q6Y0I5_9SPHI|nr:efflux RND transporter periplasmic adaptor subunit [Sphingobacterium corticibacterium]RZF62717.1 efflux RND transporter periplasmic adaptor subunit [Sphingobacterium corticibacterium]
MKISFLNLSVSAVCFVFLLSSCGQADRSLAIPDTDTIPVTLMTLHSNETNATFEATGTFTTDDETLLGFKNGGVIEQIYVREGDPIKTGQLLARVHKDEVETMASQASLALEKAQRDYERARKLYYDSVSTLEQMQNAKTALDLAQQDIKRTRFHEQYTEIRSTSNGYVLARLAQEGQVVGPGTPVLQINGANDGNWQLKVGVSDRQWAAVQEGDSARISSDVLGEGTYRAIVQKKSKGLDPKTGTFSVFLSLTADAPAKLAAGMFGKAYMQLRSAQHSAWTIPYESLLEGNGKEGYVFVTDDRKTARKVKVQIASINKDDVLISSGLEGATALIVSGSPYLVDRTPIKVIEK